MNIVIDPALKAYIDPLTPEEYESLERSLLAEGCRDALVLWGEVLVDGHNRHGICQKHGLPFQTVQNPRFQSIEDVHLWMIDQHLGRRSVSSFQRGILALRKSEIMSERNAQARARLTAATQAALSGPQADAEPSADAAAAAAELPPAERLDSREAIARAARLSASQVTMIEKIQKQATPEVVAALRAGSISLSTAATLATLPAEAQVAAAEAGAAELKQAARQVREAKRKPREAPAEAAQATPTGDGWTTAAAEGDTVASLRLRVAELTAENLALRQQLAALQGA